MTSKWVWLISRVARRIWFRATLFSVLAVATALIAIFAAPYIPPGLSTQIGADAVDNVLGIIASSMLTVTTFSLSTMVAAYSAATSNVTPRATRLVMEDSTTQNVLATFIGSFLFSLVGIALTTGAYGEQGRLILFGVTIGVIVLIVVTLLRWIDHLSRLGRVTETTERVEEVTVKAMKAYCAELYLGGHPLEQGSCRVGRSNHPLFANKIGYVQHLDAAALSAIAEEADLEISVIAVPGKLVAPPEPIAWVTQKPTDESRARICACFTIGDTRSFEQDPRFGASVLAEIASRALSPAVNDPGTPLMSYRGLSVSLLSGQNLTIHRLARSVILDFMLPRSQLQTCSTTCSRQLPGTALVSSKWAFACRNHFRYFHVLKEGRSKTRQSDTLKKHSHGRKLLCILIRRNNACERHRWSQIVPLLDWARSSVALSSSGMG